MAAKVNCSICGKLTDPSLENCPHCGSPVEVGRVAPPPPPIDGSNDDQCPSCGAKVQDGDIVCVRCGVNLLTGHQVADKQPQVLTAPPRSKTPLLIGGLVIVVVGLVGALAFLLLQDPIHAARVKARDGDTLGAIDILRKHTDTAQDDVDAFAMLGRLYWQTSQYPDASTAFETASRLRPEDEDLAFMTVLATGKLPEATGAARQMAALKRMVEEHPGNAQAVKMLALAEGAAGDVASSSESLDTLEALSGGSEDVVAYRGIVRALSGDYDGARTSLDATLPTDSNAQLAKGYLASLEGATETATALLADAVAASGEGDKAAATRLGLLYMAEGNFDKALPLLRPVQGAQPSDSSRFFYALCLQTSGLGDEALMDFERLVSGGGPYAEESAVQMGILYTERDQLDRAEESLRKARKFGTSPRIYTLEGQIAALQGDLVSAQELYRKAIQEDNDYPAAHLEHGLAYVRRSALSEGLRELERYLQLADANVVGGRVNEVDLLVKQLQQALDRGQG